VDDWWTAIGSDKGNNDGQALLSLTCTKGTSYTIALNQGLSPAGTVAMRQLRSSTGTLNYTLYVDADRNFIWGDGTMGTVITGSNGIDPKRAFVIYGRVVSRPFAPVTAHFFDSVVVSIVY
jgi:spore coat protein U-like protein